jgi:hypothetical protein
VLEAKLVINGMAISIGSEFIENGVEKPDASKQDCELNAFRRLAEKLKKRFPRLPVCLCMDSLYACNPVFTLCNQYNWQYIIRFKDGSIPTVAEEFHVLKLMEGNQTLTETEVETGITKTYRYACGIPYGTHLLNIVEYTQSDMPYPFVYLTGLPVSNRNCKQTVEDGRDRWKIENEGFNAQKNEGYELEHLFSEDPTAMKNHYLLIQIRHMIFQFFANAISIWKQLRQPLYAIVEHVKLSFQRSCLTEDDIQLINRKRQYRFP